MKTLSPAKKLARLEALLHKGYVHGNELDLVAFANSIPEKKRKLGAIIGNAWVFRAPEVTPGSVLIESFTVTRIDGVRLEDAQAFATELDAKKAQRNQLAEKFVTTLMKLDWEIAAIEAAGTPASLEPIVNKKFPRKADASTDEARAEVLANTKPVEPKARKQKVAAEPTAAPAEKPAKGRNGKKAAEAPAPVKLAPTQPAKRKAKDPSVVAKADKIVAMADEKAKRQKKAEQKVRQIAEKQIAAPLAATGTDDDV